jgi:uncharacterized protein (DUF849 family)
MARGGEVIITCAVTGSIHTPTMSPDPSLGIASPKEARAMLSLKGGDAVAF